MKFHKTKEYKEKRRKIAIRLGQDIDIQKRKSIKMKKNSKKKNIDKKY